MSDGLFSLFRRRVTVTGEEPVPEPEKPVSPGAFVFQHYTCRATLPWLSDRPMLCEVYNRYSRVHAGGYYEVVGRANPWDSPVSLLQSSSTSIGHAMDLCMSVGYVFTNMEPDLLAVWNEYLAEKEKEK